MSDWRDRLAEARARAVFEPTPSGATPYTVTVERLAEMLDATEVARAASTAESPASVLASAVAVLLRESINARLYDDNMRTRMHTQPDRVDGLCDLLDTLLSRMPEIPRG